MVRATAGSPPAAREATFARAPLTQAIADALAAAWTHGSYADLADAAIDVVCRHVVDAGIAADGDLDDRVRIAIANAIRDHAERDFAPLPAPAIDGQLTLFDQVEGGALRIGGAA